MRVKALQDWCIAKKDVVTWVRKHKWRRLGLTLFKNLRRRNHSLTLVLTIMALGSKIASNKLRQLRVGPIWDYNG